MEFGTRYPSGYPILSIGASPFPQQKIVTRYSKVDPIDTPKFSDIVD